MSNRSQVLEKAFQEVFAICRGKRWEMCIPVQEETDSDCVIIAGLKIGEEAEALREANRWIPIRERLPEPMQDIRTFNAGQAYGSPFKIGSYYGIIDGEYMVCDGGEYSYSFTHWKPQEEPPNGI